RIYALTEMRDRIAGLEGKIATLRAKMPKGMWDEYTVSRGDYLWKISRNQYGDGIQWYRIYSFNRDQIGDNPDLIYPERVLKIHRENAPGEYLVGPGDNLAKIAGSMAVMGDPTKWRQLYEANKNIVGDDPGLIYPHTVLKIPGR
ncbi:MAG: LysM peptidoglycan-binding domain-containing protein, partial [bacterium]